MRLIFMGTPEFAVPSLDRLVRDGHDVAAVFTQPDKPAGRGKNLHAPAVKTYAFKHSIAVHQPAKIKTNDEVRALFERIAPDACVVAAYGKILPDWLLAIPRLGCVNVHASLLPKYRGAAPINWAIANGERETGVTIIQMDPGMDTGPMLAKRSIAIGYHETAPELSTRLAQLGAELLSETLPLIESGRATPESQDDAAATYAPLLRREDGLIDWTRRADEIANRIRGFQPWPGAYTRVRGARLTLWGGEAMMKDPIAAAPGTDLQSAQASPPLPVEPGTILWIDDAGVFVSCGGGSVLRVEEMQLEGKRRIPARDVANGLRLMVGDRVG